MMRWDDTDVAGLGHELVNTGLATPNRYDHLSLDPALCPYLRSLLDEAARDALTPRWAEVMGEYARFLGQQQRQNIDIAATLTRLELPNLLALLGHRGSAADAEATVDLATDLQGLLAFQGRSRLLGRVGEVRDAAAARINATWSHARFNAERSRIEDQLSSGRLREALAGAQTLHRQAGAAGENAYAHADYDIATACWLLGRVLRSAGSAQQALLHLDDATALQGSRRDTTWPWWSTHGLRLLDGARRLPPGSRSA